MTMPNQPPKQSAEEIAEHVINDIWYATNEQRYAAVAKALTDYATQERAEQKKADAEVVRGIRQMKINPMFQGLANPFVSNKTDISKDGWADLTKEVLQILASASTAIERGK